MYGSSGWRRGGGRWLIRSGDTLEVETNGPEPTAVAAESGWAAAVVRVESHWRTWHVGEADLDCWRVLLEPPQVVVIGRDITTGTWTCLEVWD